MNRSSKLLVRTVPVAVATGALALGALYATGDDAGTGPTGPTVTTQVEASPVVDWAQHRGADLGGGWSVVDTEGDGPMLTVLEHGRTVGFIEYLDFPLEMPAGDTRATLDAHVGEYVEAIGADRANMPIEGYRFVPDPVVHATASDGAIIRYGFRATMPDGRPSGRTVQWAGIRAGRIVLVSAAANDPGGLFPPEGTELTSAQLDAVAGRLDRMVRASGLPLPRPSSS